MEGSELASAKLDELFKELRVFGWNKNGSKEKARGLTHASTAQ